MLSKLKQIIIFGVIGALLVFAYVKFGTTPTYSYSGSMIVVPFDENRGDSWTPSIGNSEVNIAKNMMPTYIKVLGSNQLSQMISKRVGDQGYNVSPSRVKNMVRYSYSDELFTIDFTCTNASMEQARAVALAVSEVAPNYIQEIVGYGTIKMYDSISDDPKTNSSNPYVMAMVAFMGIAVVVVVINLIINMLDNRVKGVEDIADNFEYPVLGNIPNFYSQNKGSSYKKHGEYIKHGGDK